ncbi:pilus assembly protein PilM [Candidatus Saccharibacteria bacterium]|jgi:cell division protein ftsA|nr:pilus assembly protein PilM [Candidatus Saccharibacteria bacterium]
MVLERLRQFRQRQTQQDDYIVALDIGTEFVKALIAKMEGEEISVVGVGRKRQRLSDMHSGAIADIAAVVQNCEAALSQAEDQAGLQARRAVIGIAGELVKGITHTIKYRRPQPERPLDAAEMEFIIEKVQERAQRKAQQQIAVETGNDEVEVKLVNSALVSIHIDGYKVSNPMSFQGKEVVVQIYTAFAPMVHIGALERVADELALELVAVAAEPFAVSRSVLGADAGSSFTAILVDVGGGTTDIAVVNDGGVEGTRMFGIGGRSFTRTIAAQLDLSYEDAEKIKVNLEDRPIRQDYKRGAQKAIANTIDVWLSGVELALAEFDSVDHLPGRILLCGGGASLPQVVRALETSSWRRDLPFTKKPSVQHIAAKDVLGIRDTTGSADDHTFITAMGLLRVGYDTVATLGEGGSMKDRINRMLKI